MLKKRMNIDEMADDAEDAVGLHVLTFFIFVDTLFFWSRKSLPTTNQKLGLKVKCQTTMLMKNMTTITRRIISIMVRTTTWMTWVVVVVAMKVVAVRESSSSSIRESLLASLAQVVIMIEQRDDKYCS